MKISKLLFVISLFCAGCTPNFDTMIAEYSRTETENEVNDLIINTGGYRSDSLYEIECKILDSVGKLSTCSLDDAISLHLSNCVSKRPCKNHPIFEVKDTSLVVLPIYGDGLWDYIWGLIIVNTNDLTVLNAQFDHVAETPGMGAQIRDSSFRTQFSQKAFKFDYSFALRNDSLNQVDLNEIDGISGSTVTSNGVVAMFNSGYNIFKNYLKVTKNKNQLNN